MTAIAALSYAARFAGGDAAVRDFFFRWSTAIFTFAFDGLVLVLLVLIARGLPLRETFALRRPPSWPASWRIAGGALAATYAVSFLEEIALGHGSREQAVPQFWDPTRADAFIANAIAIALFVPLVEEAACRGLGFRLLEAHGQRVAIVGSGIAFALAHGAVIDLPWVLVTGLGLGYLRSRSGSLYPCVALHAIVNGVAVLASAATSAGG
ncbi:MAG TPA: CPBP family intramembrane glutamic endopeptidase [Candidatus Limnocylindria bacterium]|jgi:membrane protease YdiL (CAAX protease family)|nr:CPBP family intramembrane glutamic endopeptidase [Candidatus Limnocylindria bacterium]